MALEKNNEAHGCLRFLQDAWQNHPENSVRYYHAFAAVLRRIDAGALIWMNSIRGRRTPAPWVRR